MLTLTLALLAFVADAQEPSPASRCADARPGDEVEVCLKEAAANPEQVDAISAALQAHIDRGTTADRELLGALLILMSDETGVIGAERLATAADPRAVQPLIHAAENRQIPIATAAVAALATYEESVEPLTRWIRDDSWSDNDDLKNAVKLAAAQALGQIHSEEAADALVDTLRRPGIAPNIRRAMREVVQVSYPHRLEELDGQVSVNGAPWITAGSAFALGYSMTAAGYYGQTSNQLAPLGGGTGVVVGATAGYLYARAWPVEAGDAAFIASSGFMGTVSGFFVGSGLEVSDPAGAGFLIGLGGEVIGYGLGIGLRDVHQGEARDAWEAMALGSIGGVAVGSAAAFQRVRSRQINPQNDPRSVNLEIGIGVAAGTIAGQIAAPHVQLTFNDTAMLGVASAYGLAAGSLIPTGDGFRRGLPSLGLATGSLVGYGLAGSVEPKGDVLIGGVTGAAFGGFFGAGVGQILAPREPQAIQGSALLGITGGLVAGSYFSHVNPDPIDDRDVVLTTLTTSWAAWQTAGWAAFADSQGTIPGPLYAIPALTGATTAALSGELDIPVTHSSSATSLGLWGAYVGAVSAELVQADPLLYSLVGSDMGLVGGAVVMSPLVGTPPLVIGLADAGGVLGGSTSALGAAIATDDPQTILIASLVGSGLGLTAGAIVGSQWYRSGISRNMAISIPNLPIPGRFSVAPARLQGQREAVLGLRLRMDQW